MKTPRADCTLEFKKQAVRLVRGGQRQSEDGASSLGISGQTLGNGVKVDAAGRFTERKAVKVVSDKHTGRAGHCQSKRLRRLYAIKTPG